MTDDSKIIDFYFDFSSPYGYLASRRIEALAARHNRTVHWHPILLGVIFKVSQQAPLLNYPLKGDYAKHDFARSAREHGTPYRHPTHFPVSGVAACRAWYWMSEHGDASIASKAQAFLHAVLDAYYRDDRHIGEPATIVDIAAEIGVPRDAVQQALADDTVKARVKAVMEAVIAAGIFGSPTMVVDGEMFWGNDRLEQLDRWLERGGW